jgi:hypothetical protein
MTADANLVDARTGALIIAHRDLTVILPTGQGLGWNRCSGRDRQRFRAGPLPTRLPINMVRTTAPGCCAGLSRPHC